jgi:plastocyanin domain-containing protein
MKEILIAIGIAIIILGGTLIFVYKGGIGNSEQTSPANNVSIVDGKQIIEITARGGYQPRKSVAKAGISTIIRFETRGTFDCSSSVRIASLNIFKSLPQTGSTDIDIGAQKAAVIKGSCGMGMYPFEIDFQG